MTHAVCIFLFNCYASGGRSGSSYSSQSVAQTGSQPTRQAEGQPDRPSTGGQMGRQTGGQTGRSGSALLFLLCSRSALLFLLLALCSGALLCPALWSWLPLPAHPRGKAYLNLFLYNSLCMRPQSYHPMSVLCVVFCRLSSSSRQSEYDDDDRPKRCTISQRIRF